MFIKHIVIRIEKIINLNKRDKQIKIIYIVNYFREFLILIARTSFEKSLIFNVLSLLLSTKISVILIVLFLKLISKQQFNRVKRYNRNKFFIYNINYKLRINQLRIAINLYIYNNVFFVKTN